MNMRSGVGRGLEFALEVVQRYVVADHVGVCVDAEEEGACCAGDATCGCGAVDDLVGRGMDGVHRRELEEVCDVVCCNGAVLVYVNVELERNMAVADVHGDGRCTESQKGEGGYCRSLHYGQQNEGLLKEGIKN